MVLLLSAVEEYKAEVVSSSSSTMPAEERIAPEVLAEIQKSREVLSYLEDGEWIEYPFALVPVINSFGSSKP
jgi:hypothetical protein